MGLLGLTELHHCSLQYLSHLSLTYEIHAFGLVLSMYTLFDQKEKQFSSSPNSPQHLSTVCSSGSVHAWCPALPACSPYVAPAKPALHQGLYWLCRGRIVRGLYWPEQRRPILAVPPSQATHPLAPCEPFHPHGSDLPASVLCVASTCRHM